MHWNSTRNKNPEKRDETKEKSSSDKRGPLKMHQQHAKGVENKYFSMFTRVQTHKHSQVAAFSHQILWWVLPLGVKSSWSPAGVTTQPAGSSVWMTGLWRRRQYRSAHTRGRCLVERKASTVNKGSSGRTDSSPLLCWWSAALIFRDKISCFFINPGASRREQFALLLWRCHWGLLLGEGQGEGGRRTGGRS